MLISGYFGVTTTVGENKLKVLYTTKLEFLMTNVDSVYIFKILYVVFFPSIFLNQYVIATTIPMVK